MKSNLIIEIIKEFNSSNISKMNLKYKKIEISLEKGSVNPRLGENLSSNEKWINSPIVGKMHKIDIKEGDVIKKGDNICTIESMKTFNEIKSDDSYVVIKVATKENDYMEYNKRIVLVRKLDDKEDTSSQ